MNRTLRQVATTTWITAVAFLAPFFPCTSPCRAESDAAAPAAAAPPGEASGKDAAGQQAPAEDPHAKEQAARMEAFLNTTTPVGPFTNKTDVEGKVPVDLTGVWLVVANTKPSPKHAPEAFQSFVQVMKVTGGNTDKPTFTMLDLQLPAPIQADIDKSMGNLVAWQPKPEQLQTLKQTWSSLQPYKEKNLNQNILASVDYTLIAPDHYKDEMKVLPAELLDGSTFALNVSERYRPGQVPKDAPMAIAQLMGRDSSYVFTTTDKQPTQLNGGAMIKFTAAGAGFPLPMGFGGRVVMYKLGTPS